MVNLWKLLFIVLQSFKVKTLSSILRQYFQCNRSLKKQEICQDLLFFFFFLNDRTFPWIMALKWAKMTPIKHFLWHLSLLAIRPELDRVLPMYNTSHPVYTCTWHMHSFFFFSWLVREVTIWTRITVVRHLAGSLLGSHDYRITNEIHGRCSRVERLRLVPQLLIDSCIVSPQRRNREGNQTFSAVQAV